MTRTFHKMHGLGNDFVIIDARDQPLKVTPQLARAISDRKTGIGCDQLILLENSSRAKLAMRIWNPDGGEVEACGNASRCVIALTGATSIETAGGLIQGSAADRANVEVTLGEPRFGWDEIPLAYPLDTTALPMAWGELEHPIALSVGNPHLVFFVPDVASVPLEQLGPTIENDPIFPERLNVTVATIDGDRIQLRTWERGAGLTRACGTGACATAVAALASRRASGPLTVTMPGGSLTVGWTPGSPIVMQGPATHVFSGTVTLEALA